MKKSYNNIFKYTICLLLILGLFATLKTSNTIVYADKVQNKKAVVLVLDVISLEELSQSNTPNIDLLLKNGSVGLMNTRSRSRVSNKSSAYLSLGMGVKTLASSKGNLAFDRDTLYAISDYQAFEEDAKVSEMYKLYTGKTAPEGEILNLSIADIEKVALGITPNNEVGLLGKKARENGITVGLLGNSDLSTPAREASLLAMDEKGAIPFGSISSDLLINDPSILGGLRLDENKLSNELDRILPSVDMLFIDYGDASRVENSVNIATDDIIKSQKIKSIERADSFLSTVMNKVDLNNTLFMIVTPNPSKSTIKDGNFALTPFIMSSKDTKSGLLTSDSTRRKGLVANFNFAPTLLEHFGVTDNDGFTGGPIQSIESEESIDKLVKDENQFLYLRKYRYIFHWAFIVLAGVSLIGLYISKFTKLKILPQNFLKYLSLATLATPLTMMIVSLIGYKSIIIDLIFVIGGAFLIAYVLSKVFKDNFKIMAVIGFSISLFLLIDIFFIEKLMIVSPLGSDAIAGGRFYGIGNDYMGILLGSALLGIFSVFHIYNLNKHVVAIFTAIYMFVIILALSPFFGANVGGTLSAMVVTLLALLAILDKKISFKKILFIFLGVFLTIILFAALDISFNPNPSHAGRALQGLMTDGTSKFIEIITLKIGQVFWNLFNASWKIILFLEAVIALLFYKFKQTSLLSLKAQYPILIKGFIIIQIGSIIVFLFNDTGTIATSLMLLYSFIPLGLILRDHKDIKNPEK